MAAYCYPRATGDFDMWVDNSPDNSVRIYQALSEFGAPLDNIGQNTFSHENTVFQIGVAPGRIDILTSIDGLDFDQAYDAKVDFEYDGLTLPFISRMNLIKNKLSTGRQRDVLDARILEELE